MTAATEFYAGLKEELSQDRARPGEARHVTHQSHDRKITGISETHTPSIVAQKAFEERQLELFPPR